MLLQSLFVLIISAIFFIVSVINNGLEIVLHSEMHLTLLSIQSLFYGGLVSILNNYLIIRISNKQERIKIHNASIGLRIMVVSVVTRLVLIALLIVLGFRLGLLPFELLAGFISGQVGLLIDKLKNKG